MNFIEISTAIVVVQSFQILSPIQQHVVSSRLQLPVVVPLILQKPNHPGIRVHNVAISLLASNTEPSSSTSVSSSSSSSSSQQQQLPTLSYDTTWMIRITLRNIKTQQGQTIMNQMYVMNGQFIPEENYEPPQGKFVQALQQMTNVESSSTEITKSNSNDDYSSNTMQIASSRWILSEDPNDRKDGLWIWGLFQQPLYPYMLLSLETKPITIRNNSINNNNDNDNDDNKKMTDDYIPALQLYVQLDHNCNRDTGAVSFLKTKRSTSTSSSSDTGGNNNYELMIRQKEIIAADPLSLSKVEIYEEVSIGTISIQPK